MCAFFTSTRSFYPSADIQHTEHMLTKCIAMHGCMRHRTEWIRQAQHTHASNLIATRYVYWTRYLYLLWCGIRWRIRALCCGCMMSGRRKCSFLNRRSSGEQANEHVYMCTCQKDTFLHFVVPTILKFRYDIQRAIATPVEPQRIPGNYL